MDEKLELSREEMRTLGYRVVDLIADHFEHLNDKPVGVKGDPALLRPMLLEPPPDRPGSVQEILARLERDVFPNIMNICHPRFFAFVPGPSNFVSVMADALAAGFNVFNGSWLGGSSAAAMELAVIDWFRGWCGFPEEAGGLFVSGGSMANLTALVAARHAKLDDRVDRAVIYYSDQTHSSIDRALRVIGFLAGTNSPDSVGSRISPADGGFDGAGGAGSRGGFAAVRGDRQRGDHQYGRDRSAARDRRGLPRAGFVDARRRRIWRRGGDLRKRAQAAGRDRAGGFVVVRPAQVAVSDHRMRLRAAARRGSC